MPYVTERRKVGCQALVSLCQRANAFSMPRLTAVGSPTDVVGKLQQRFIQFHPAHSPLISAPYTWVSIKSARPSMAVAR